LDVFGSPPRRCRVCLEFGNDLIPVFVNRSSCVVISRLISDRTTLCLAPLNSLNSLRETREFLTGFRRRLWASLKRSRAVCFCVLFGNGQLSVVSCGGTRKAHRSNTCETTDNEQLTNNSHDSGTRMMQEEFLSVTVVWAIQPI
jgi:hypothetical protein